MFLIQNTYTKCHVAKLFALPHLVEGIQDLPLKRDVFPMECGHWCFFNHLGVVIMIILHSISLIERHLQEPRGQSSLRSMNQPQYLNLVKLYREVAGMKQNKVSTLRRLRLNNSLPISRTSTLSPGSIATLLLSRVGVSETKFMGH